MVTWLAAVVCAVMLVLIILFPANRVYAQTSEFQISADTNADSKVPDLATEPIKTEVSETTYRGEDIAHVDAVGHFPYLEPKDEQRWTAGALQVQSYTACSYGYWDR